MSGIIDQQVYTYSRVPSVGVYLLINNPRPPLIVNFSILFHPGHIYSNLP